jgi:hypothetical protein
MEEIFTSLISMQRHEPDSNRRGRRTRFLILEVLTTDY